MDSICLRKIFKLLDGGAVLENPCLGPHDDIGKCNKSALDKERISNLWIIVLRYAKMLRTSFDGRGYHYWGISFPDLAVSAAKEMWWRYQGRHRN